MADDSSGALSGAASGAATGSAFGPWGTVIGAGIGLVGGILGNEQSAQNAANANAASEDMFYANLQFQDRLAQNAMQYRVNDLKAAGLNPILAAGGSGASASGGSGIPAVQQPNYRNLGEAATSGASAAMAFQQSQQQVELLKAQTLQAAAGANANNATAAKANADARATNQQTDFNEIISVGDKDNPSLVNNMTLRFVNQMSSLSAGIDLSKGQLQAVVAEVARSPDLQAVMKSEAVRNLSAAGQAAVQTALSRTMLPAAQAQERHDRQLGIAVPYAKDVGSLLNSAHTASEIYRNVRGPLDFSRYTSPDRFGGVESTTTYHR